MAERVIIRGRGSIRVGVQEGTAGATVNLVSNAFIDFVFSKQLWKIITSNTRKVIKWKLTQAG